MKFFAVLLALLLSFKASAQCAYPQLDGTLIFTADTAATCNGLWLISATEYSAYLSAIEITASEVTEAFMWGFGTVVVLAFLSFKVGIATKIVRRI
jgi:hypothetical protein